jgi:hypothetical protein
MQNYYFNQDNHHEEEAKESSSDDDDDGDCHEEVKHETPPEQAKAWLGQVASITTKNLDTDLYTSMKYICTYNEDVFAKAVNLANATIDKATEGKGYEVHPPSDQDFELDSMDRSFLLPSKDTEENSKFIKPYISGKWKRVGKEVVVSIKSDVLATGTILRDLPGMYSQTRGGSNR